MSFFHYKANELFAENISVRYIAEQFGTPCYIYSRAAIEQKWHEFNNALQMTPHRICYAVKANSNIAILGLLAKLGSGFDIVSEGELERVIYAGGDPQKIIFSGVGKQIKEINQALHRGIFCFNIESESELERLDILARKHRKIANISLRVNPNINAHTHPYISTGLHENKFGIEMDSIFSMYQKIRCLSHVKLIGIGCHIGSQLTTLEPFSEAIDCLLEIIKQLSSQGCQLKYINMGGGLGVTYQHEKIPTIEDYVAAIRQKIEKSSLKIILEPGRAIVANSGILLTKVEYIKQSRHKNFAIVDAGMNDLIRPALYEAWQNIIPIQLNEDIPKKYYDVVGPVCESADFLGKNRLLALQENDLLAVCSAGAYGASMSSNYNSRPRAAEVLVEDDKVYLIRQREVIQDLFRHEQNV